MGGKLWEEIKKKLDVPISGQAVWKEYKNLISKYNFFKEAFGQLGIVGNFAYSNVLNDVIENKVLNEPFTRLDINRSNKFIYTQHNEDNNLSDESGDNGHTLCQDRDNI